MSIRNQLLFTTALIFFMMIFTAFVMQLTNTKQRQLYEKQANRYDSYLLADELRQSSDDLTRLARTYVLTGDSKYENMYWDILKIRNGEKARPQHMEHIYWDLVLSYGQKPSPDGDAVPLQQLMEEAGFTDSEFEKLSEAQKNSDDLVTTETIAMNAMKGLFDSGNGNYSKRGTPDPEMASRIMHDNQYHSNKAKIMAPVNDFLSLLDKRTSTEVSELRENLHFYQKLLTLLFMVTVTVIASSLLTTYRSVIRQLGGEPKVVLYHMHRIADGDLSNQTNSASEGLVKALEVMADKLRATVKNVKSASGKVSSAAEDLIVISSQTSKGLNQQFTNVEQVCSAMGQMSSTASEVAHSTETASISAQSVNEQVQESNRIVSDAVNNARHLSKEVSDTAEVIRELRSESNNVGAVLNVIRDIAEQTNLLALNAAIEAARAGEQGRGFAVVADEVRTLASRTQQSTTEIQDIIASLQDGAENATVAMERGQQTVEKTVEDIECAGNSLLQIAAAITEITDQNSKIATASNEQHSLAEEVSKNVGSITDVANETRKGSDLVAKSSRQLADLASNLKSTVGVFNT